MRKLSKFKVVLSTVKSNFADYIFYCIEIHEEIGSINLDLNRGFISSKNGKWDGKCNLRGEMSFRKCCRQAPYSTSLSLPWDQTASEARLYLLWQAFGINTWRQRPNYIQQASRVGSEAAWVSPRAKVIGSFYTIVIEVAGFSTEKKIIKRNWIYFLRSQIT